MAKLTHPRRDALVNLPLLFVVACASTGTRPQDMTSAQHESAAAKAEAEGSHHEGQHDPVAIAAPVPRAGMVTNCPGYSGSDCLPWSGVTNPTARHLEDARAFRALAAKHRAASTTLQAAEARACEAVSAYDRDVSPFYHREDIVRGEKIEKEAFGPGGLLGARVVFRDKPGLSVEWLQRVMDCHLARWEALGVEDPALTYCPLTLKGVSVKVKPARGGVAVEIFANDEKTATVVIARARALVDRT